MDKIEREARRIILRKLFLMILFQSGGVWPTVVEHPVMVKRSQTVQWKRKIFNLSKEKLATLRASHGWTIAQTAEHLGLSELVIKRCLYGFARKDVKGKRRL